ncbi:vWA domain-containing protein [Labedaea rhizosphaerae]|uniref:VWFA domain-containing protein n=1 Tax=Labedaea rhizosphaerae TaxID=598644 RepID=A0A4R6S0B4_LABRH|nr:vWA domain-containing protein [Labedaea rhizosphaerae]TDP92922.1 hypothetical protein EV186_107157 [Labedaea rhizosphaerae]
MTTATPDRGQRLVERIPLHQKQPTAKPPKKMPHWLARLLQLLAILLLLLLAVVSCRESEKPTSLATSTLAGPRLVTGPICLEEAVDVSGSMEQFRDQREQAELALFTFARRVLTDADRLSTAFFAGSGELALRPTALRSLTRPPRMPTITQPDGTNLGPAVDKLVAARTRNGKASTCAARALVVITDGLLGDEQAAISKSLRAGNYTRIFAVIPAETGWGRPSELTGGALDSVSVYHFTGSGLGARLASVFADGKPLDVVLGEIVGSLTGQHLDQLPTN